MKSKLLLSLIAVAASLTFSVPARSQTAVEPLVQFQRDVQPILQQHCLQCHGPSESKGGFRVDELESLKGYIEAGNADSSSLWTDYLHTKDPDSLMPPPSGSSPGGLLTSDLLVIRTWINEGATGEWLTDAKPQQEQPKSNIPTSDLGKLWAFQGLFHPAATHLPVALLAVSAMFLAFSFINRDACEPVAFHCLWVGAIGAVFACLTGWSYAVYEGYGTGVTFDLEGRAIDRHRWLGVFVAVFSLLMIPLARSVRKTEDVKKKIMWFFASLIMMGAVSIVGFQGGELTYGEGHYSKYFDQLFGPPTTSSQTDKPAEQSPAKVDDSEPAGKPTESAPVQAAPATNAS